MTPLMVAACATVCCNAERLVMVEDISTCPLIWGRKKLEAHLANGVLSFLLTPLVSRSRKLLGILQTSVLPPLRHGGRPCTHRPLPGSESAASAHGVVQGSIGDDLAVQGDAHVRNEMAGIKICFEKFMVDRYGVISNHDPVGDNKE